MDHSLRKSWPCGVRLINQPDKLLDALDLLRDPERYGHLTEGNERSAADLLCEVV